MSTIESFPCCTQSPMGMLRLQLRVLRDSAVNPFWIKLGTLRLPLSASIIRPSVSS